MNCKSFIIWKRSISRGLAFFIFAISFLPYIPQIVSLSATEHGVEYNRNPAYHYDGSLWEPGQWYGSYIVGGYLFSEKEEFTIEKWDKARIPAGLPIASTNFKVPDAGVKLNTVAFCLKPSAPNWPSVIRAYEITPELCNEFGDISETRITEREIDALHIALKTLGLTKNAVNVSSEAYTAMRFVCWYIGKCGWQSKTQFMNGINQIKEMLDNNQVNKSKFVSLCSKAAGQIEASIGNTESGQTTYMPAFAGRYSNKAPLIEFTGSVNGTFTFEYRYQIPSDRYWKYKCPAGVTAEYTPESVLFTSTVAEPEGLFEGTLQTGNLIPGVVPAGGILICRSDDDETQDMLVPYSGPQSELTCYFTARAGSENVSTPGAAEFPMLPDVEFYRCDLTFKGHYNVEVEKYDSETDQKLAGVEFEVLEQSPSEQPSILDNYWGSNIDTWNGWRQCKRVETNSRGHFEHTDTRTYDYTGTYCGGHDAQRLTIEAYEAFILQCEEENTQQEEGKSGRGSDRISVEDDDPLWDTDAMRGHLSSLEDGYEKQVGVCEDFAGISAYHFFHSESGSSNQQKEMSEDKQEAYETFINLKYDYTVREIRAHSGYVLHGKHEDDNPISIIRTPSSESGHAGYVIESDNRAGSLPAVYENAVASDRWSGMPETGSLILPGELKETPEKKRSEKRDHEGDFNLKKPGHSDLISTERIVTPSDATPSDATPSNAFINDKNFLFHFPESTAHNIPEPMEDGTDSPYTVASWEPDWRTGSAAGISTGPEGHVLYTWNIWNHRVEGEVHINKRDMELAAGGNKDPAYDSYGDTQGDATLEGAVYGLYAAQDIAHPDGRSGNVFSANELVSIASTDKNGDASFLVITETSATSTVIGNNYDGMYSNRSNPAAYTDNLTVNGGQWIGRPLILGRYYIKEIGRSEGYELSITGNTPDAETNYGSEGATASDHGTAHVNAILAGGGNYGTNGSVIEIETHNAMDGVELYLYNYPADMEFGIMRTGTIVKPGQVVSGWEDKPVYMTTGGIRVFRNTSGAGRAYYRLDYNNTTGRYERYEADMAMPLYMLHKAGDMKMDSHGNLIPVKDTEGNIRYTTVPEIKKVSYRISQPWTAGNVKIPADISDVRNTANELLKEAGYYTLIPPSARSPWFKLALTGTDQEQVEQILSWFKDRPFYNAAHVERVVDAGDIKTALLRYDYLAPGTAPAVRHGTELYVKELIPSGNGLYYYVPYGVNNYILEDNGTATVTELQQVTENITMDQAIEDYIKIRYIPQYEVYTYNENILDASGNPVPVTESVPEVSENINVSGTKTIDYLTDIAEYDSVRKCFKVLIRPERLADEEKDGVLRIETVHKGMTSKKVNGQTLQAGEYLKYVLGISASASSPAMDWTGTYIKDSILTYGGQYADVYEDSGTRARPICVEERIIRQKVKVAKDILVGKEGAYEDNTYGIHEDWFTKLYGGLEETGTTAGKMHNFRFKTYLRSNLEQLYRDYEGSIVWQNRRGDTIDIMEAKKHYPVLVQNLYTKAPHSSTPLYHDSKNAIMANHCLYGYTDGLINETQNTGYTAVLETIESLEEDGTGTGMVKSRNFKKFFDALAVANNDKWKDAAPTYTSWQPVGNEVNRVDATVVNAKASDMVRQFAIDWYLEDEAAKLLKPAADNPDEYEYAGGNVSHTDGLYDEALRNAIIKSENYLLPFFTYDLDRIYSIEWDSDPAGGADADKTTLAANQLQGDVGADSSGYYFGISEYLPYGTYVVVEQQPKYTGLKDFPNRHYQTDAPQEVTLPAVYAGYEESQRTPEIYNSYYNYQPAMAPESLLDRYNIRFNEESHVIQAHNNDGDFEIFKYGLAIGYIRNGAGTAGAGDYFALTQNEWRPYKNYYNPQDDRAVGEVPYYLSEGQSGRAKVSRYYRYSSVSEYQDTADRLSTMKGNHTACEGQYAPMLAAWSMAAPIDSETEARDIRPKPTGECSFKGYAYTKFRNRFYTSRLRIEKLDSETHENILHDNAIFNIYAAEREDAPDGTGQVKFYDKDTTIIGSREFLEAMGASNITAMMRSDKSGKASGAGTLYSGLVPAGTPICKEKEQIFLTDGHGNQTGAFKSYTTTRHSQNTGYLETPQPLGAGVYVLIEVKPPSGYVRTKPIAVEIYSDAITYYKEGSRDKRVAAAIYNNSSGHGVPGGPQDTSALARINVENTPITLTIEKVKESGAGSARHETVTYKVSGRIDGSLTQIGNNPNYEYAFENGDYLGYAWVKGTLEYLMARKDAGEDVRIVYNGLNFTGYGYVTKKLETSDDVNKYVAGATMTLFEALELKRSGDSEDHAYEGLVIERMGTGNVARMYVKQGYAGFTMEYIQDTAEDGTFWTAKPMERPDTDILYYDLDSLDMFRKETVNGRRVLYGYDRNHGNVAISQLESDKANYVKTDQEHSLFAFKGGIPYLEFVGGDFTKIVYSSKDKSIKTGAGTRVYHIDQEGNRDALVDSHTGMAYVLESGTEDDVSEADRVMVWPIHIARDNYGNVISRDKISTSRIATVGENQDGYDEHVMINPTNNSGQIIPDRDKPSYDHTESGYISGSWISEEGEESHQESTVNQNSFGQNMNEDVLTNDNRGSFPKDLNPFYNKYGLAEYYQRSREIYSKRTNLSDRNNDPVRHKYSDHLGRYNSAAYMIADADELGDHDKRLNHRQGENYILENTWITSDRTPNNPFDSDAADGQPDVLKRIPAGAYMMEELISPAGYLKGMPIGITVKEISAYQSAAMTDKTTKAEITKVDGTGSYVYQVLDMEHLDPFGNPIVIGNTVEGKGRYSHQLLAGAKLALYEAERVYTDDWMIHTKGWFLKKKSSDAAPFQYLSTDSTGTNPIPIQTVWTTDAAPVYLEGIPEGDYILEELKVPSGYVKSRPLEIHVANSPEVQLFTMPDDHTKMEIEKYVWEGGSKRLKNGAGFTLYEAKTDGQGNVLYEDGSPQYNSGRVIDSWISSDATDYTDTVEVRQNASSGQSWGISGFTAEFEKMYKQFGTVPGTSIGWSVERSAVKNTAHDGIWELEDGLRIVESGGALLFPQGTEGFDKEAFQRAWESRQTGQRTIRWLEDRRAAYITHTQIDKNGGDAAEGNIRFPVTAEIIYRTDEGKDVRITVYQESADRQGRTFTFEYQFEYRQLDHVNEMACSYLTEEGRRRFDYLPAGASYVLVETGVPAGCEQASDRLITIGSTEHVQFYSVENKAGELLISKTGSDQGKELAGAKLALYRGAEDESYMEDPSYLIDIWISGEDGTYSESDAVNNRIPAGYKKGDSKPHAIRGLEEGIYYLVELSSPPYYTKIEPMRLEYHLSSDHQIIRASDIPVTGELEIIKQSPEGASLSGVVFEVNAYRQGSREAAWTAEVSDTDGVVRLRNMPVGESDEAGRIIPYSYKVREVIPPEGYAVNTELHTFRFAPDMNGASYAPDNSARISLTIKNEKTKLYIEKKEFESLPYKDGAFVENALLAVYELQGRDADGLWMFDEVNDLAEVWRTSKKEKRHMIEGLKGGKTYLLKELEAPNGYALMNPVIFTVSRDGRQIQHVTEQLGAVGFDIAKYSVSVRGRYVSRVEMALEDAAGREVLRWIAAGSGQILTQSEKLTDGGTYVLTEHTIYSDGTDLVTGRTLRRLHFNEKGECRIEDRSGEHAELSVLTENGDPIWSFVPSELFPEVTIENPIRPETLEIEIKNRDGSSVEGILIQKEFVVTIHYRNLRTVAADIEITTELDERCRVLDTFKGMAAGNMIQWRIDNVAAGQEGIVTFVAELTDGDADEIAISAVANNGVSDSAVMIAAPILKPDKLTVFHQMTGSGARNHQEEPREFSIRLYHENGEELLGTIAYEGNRSGMLKSGDIIALCGNESIIIGRSMTYGNVRYIVKDLETGESHSGMLTPSGTCAVFTSKVQDPDDRLLFTKGERYTIRETTSYTDGYTNDSGQWSFAINEWGEVQGLTIYDRKQKIQVSKVDSVTGDMLAGARLQLVSQTGNTLEEWDSETTPYEIKSALSPDVSYRIREITSPAGYLPMMEEDEITFILAKNDMLLTVIVENQPDIPPVSPPKEPETQFPDKIPDKIPDNTEEPDIKPPSNEPELIMPFPFRPAENPEKAGKILAFYEPSARYPDGLVFRNPGWMFPWAKTGDDTPWNLVVALFTLSAIGFCLVLNRKKKYKE